MLIIITEQSKIAECHQSFKKFLYKNLSQTVTLNLGHLGASFEEKVHTNKKIWYLTSYPVEPGLNRHWNAFGLFPENINSDIAVEINFPLEGLNRRVAGVFAHDDNLQEIKVLHRGNIGGGRKGIGKNAFRAWYRQRYPDKFVDVDEGLSSPVESILIGTIGAPSMISSLENFVSEVLEFKNQAVR